MGPTSTTRGASSSDAGARKLALVETALGTIGGAIGTIIGWSHYRATAHVSGVLLGATVFCWSAALFVAVLRWDALGPDGRRWTRRGAHLIGLSLLIGLMLISNDVPAWPQLSRRKAASQRDRPRVVAGMLSLLLAIVGAFIGGVIGDRITNHSDLGVLVGVLVGVAIPACAGYQLVRWLSRDRWDGDRPGRGPRRLEPGSGGSPPRQRHAASATEDGRSTP